MEIRGPNPNFNQPDANPVGGPAGTGNTPKTSFSETLGTGAAGPTGGAAGTGGTGPAGPLGGIAYGQLQARIQQGVAAGQPKQQILESLIGEQLTGQLGDKATPQMTTAVAEKFQSDPQLSQLFNRLYSQATK
jgi:hypothetical protein